MTADSFDPVRLLAFCLLAGLLAAPATAAEPCAADFVDPVTGHPTHLELLVSEPAEDLRLDRAVFSPECALRRELSGIASTIGIPPRIDFYLVIDQSGSTGDASGVDLDGDGSEDSTFAAEIAAARSFVSSVNLDNNRVAIIAFDSQAHLRSPLTAERRELLGELDALLADGPLSDTNFGAAVREAVREHDLRHDPTREQVVIFLSDGRPTAEVEDPPAVGLQPCSTYDHGTRGCNGILWAEHAWVTRQMRVETFAVGRFAALPGLEEMASRAGGELTTIELAGDVARVLPSVNLVGVDRVVVRSLDTLEESLAELRPDGSWTADIGLLPGDNDLVVTAHSDHEDVWSVSCERRITLSCASHECPASEWRECRGGGGLVETLRPWTSHPEILVRSDHDPDGDGDAGGVYAVGRTEVAFLLTDVAGNTRSCTTVVEVADTLPPELVGVPAARSLECGSPLPEDSVSARDACDLELAVERERLETTLDCPANVDVLRRWRAEDAAGHAVQAEQLISVRDTQAPVILEGDDDLHCFRAPNHWELSLGREDFSPRVEDACSEVAGWWLVGCESDQPEDDRGDGRTLSDCSVTADGSRLSLRGERDGRRKEGRRYGVLVAAVDACGNWSPPARIGFVRILHDLREGERDCPIVARSGRRD